MLREVVWNKGQRLYKPITRQEIFIRAEKGMVGFIYGDKPVSEGISHIESELHPGLIRYPSHAFLYSGDHCCIEMLPKGITERPIWTYLDGKTHIEICRIDRITQMQIGLMMDYAYQQLDLKVKYDFKAIWGYFWQWVTRSKNSIDDSNRQYCSEFIFEALNAAKVPLRSPAGESPDILRASPRMITVLELE